MGLTQGLPLTGVIFLGSMTTSCDPTRRSKPSTPSARSEPLLGRSFLADRLSDTQKAFAVEALVEKYGSRRALIEELDRRKRLSLLNPDPRFNVKDEYGGKTAYKGRNPKIKNETNPQWREISTPSLLFEGERRSDFVIPGPDLTAALAENRSFVTHKEQGPVILSTPDTKKRCKTCKCHLNGFTPGCETCAVRHAARRRRQNRQTFHQAQIQNGMRKEGETT